MTNTPEGFIECVTQDGECFLCRADQILAVARTADGVVKIQIAGNVVSVYLHPVPDFYDSLKQRWAEQLKLTRTPRPPLSDN